MAQLSRQEAQDLYDANARNRDFRSHVLMEVTEAHGFSGFWVVCVATRKDSGRVYCKSQAEIDAFMEEWSTPW